MTIGGLQKLTLTDYPGKLSATIFTRGCNFRCPYCHNPELVDPLRYGQPLPESEIFSFLVGRTGRLDGVVLTGGEPTVHPDLPDLVQRIKQLGFSVKLDTNGSNPEMLEHLLRQRLLDYVAIDIKSSPAFYRQVTGVEADTRKIRRSVDAVVSSGILHELRMTFIEALVPIGQIQGVAELALGCMLFLVQPFQPTKALDARLLRCPRPTLEKLKEVRDLLSMTGLPAVVR
jgi:pyruvate formate lyase activating enzyme